MPRGQVGIGASNLSLIIPRRVHRKVRLTALRCGAPSLPAFVAWWLDQIPESVSASETVAMHVYEFELQVNQSKGTTHASGRKRSM